MMLLRQVVCQFVKMGWSADNPGKSSGKTEHKGVAEQSLPNWSNMWPRFALTVLHATQLKSLFCFASFFERSWLVISLAERLKVR